MVLIVALGYDLMNSSQCPAEQLCLHPTGNPLVTSIEGILMFSCFYEQIWKSTNKYPCHWSKEKLCISKHCFILHFPLFLYKGFKRRCCCGYDSSGSLIGLQFIKMTLALVGSMVEGNLHFFPLKPQQLTSKINYFSQSPRLTGTQ